ncbi:Predicted transglutaminase-like cysteine proteinase [Devosia sp. YR412]|uniref:transglutaminase-like cysteine peptidase n=1 Tax=Devosia sp. YR412 TaxID=1881030 RepID=UPI0008D55038|nr:transglutaminase-like cysteine peptidase [Devosia sp. YR412]SEQ39873.1 Predicted transglutaminase-like cysteine proteinase [Devosia sp. YR412]
MTHITALCRKSLVYIALAACLLPATAHAAPLNQIRQAGWEAMCARDDQPMNFCAAFAGPARISYGPGLEQTLSDTNDQVNARYSFRSDNRAYGASDHWSVPTGATADCEDYVLAKIQQLQGSGVSVSAMVIMVGPLRNGRWHAVLGIKTDAGMVVLDSMTPGVTSAKAIGLTTQYTMAMNDSGHWRAAR